MILTGKSTTEGRSEVSQKGTTPHNQKIRERPPMANKSSQDGHPKKVDRKKDIPRKLSKKKDRTCYKGISRFEQKKRQKGKSSREPRARKWWGKGREAKFA